MTPVNELKRPMVGAGFCFHASCTWPIVRAKLTARVSDSAEHRKEKLISRHSVLPSADKKSKFPWPVICQLHREAPKETFQGGSAMELRTLFWTTLITGLFASAVLLFVVINQMTEQGLNNAAEQPASICLTCDSQRSK